MSIEWPVRFFAVGLPVAQPRPRFSARGGRIHTYEAKRGAPIHRWKQILRECALFTDIPDLGPLKGPVELTLDFEFPRPQRLMKIDDPVPHISRPDLDNLCKAVMDAVNGTAWEDDSQVCHLDTTKRYAKLGMVPGVMVTIGRYPY